MSAPSEKRAVLDSQAVIERLGPEWPTPLVSEQTQSTNRDLRDAAELGSPAWTIHTTDHQVAGRGRLERSFDMPQGAGVALSILLRPVAKERLAWTWLPHLVGLAVFDALESWGVQTALKWPNDVLTANGQKLAGILVERVETSTGPAAVLGVGLNVLQTAAELPYPNASSLDLAGAQQLDRHVIIADLAHRIRAWAEVWESGDMEVIKDAYRKRCLTLGQEVRILREGFDDIMGLAEDVDDFGCLIVDGTSWSAGDVQHLRPISGK